MTSPRAESEELAKAIPEVWRRGREVQEIQLFVHAHSVSPFLEFSINSSKVEEKIQIYTKNKNDKMFMIRPNLLS